MLGLSFSGHGSSICLVEDGRVVSAVNLERLTRVKFALATMPAYACRLAVVLKQAFGFERSRRSPTSTRCSPELLQAVCGETGPAAKAGIDLVVKTHDNIRPMPEDPEPYEEFCEYFAGTPTLFDLEHHLCHAYQAYLVSPFDDAAILTIDGTRREPRAARRPLDLDDDGRGPDGRVERALRDAGAVTRSAACTAT